MALVPTRRDRPRVLRELAAQLEDGRLYDRDLAPLATAMATSLTALRHRMSLLPWQEATDFVSEGAVSLDGPLRHPTVVSRQAAAVFSGPWCQAVASS